MKRVSVFLICVLVLSSSSIFGQKKELLPPTIYKNIVLFWDTSLSTQDRNLSLELAFLEAFIKDKSDLSINLVKFSNTVISEEKYAISKGNWNNLKQDLLHTKYDGATSFKLLVDKKYNAYDAFLVFTDGYQNQVTLRDNISKPLIVVSSNEKTYFQSLQLKTLSNNSQFIDFNKISLVGALDKMGIKLKEKEFEQLPKKKVKNTPFKSVSGIVTSVDEALQGVNVFVEGKKTGTVTNSNGFYSIPAEPGDRLIFSYLGFRSYKTTVSESILDIRLLTNETLLNTVEIQSKKDRKIEEDRRGLASDKDKKRGYAVQSIKSDEFSPIETNVAQSVQGKFSGVSLGQNQDISQMIIRGYNSITQNEYPLVVLDGTPLRRADSSGGDASKVDLSFIDPNNVAEIKILKGLAATNRYGSQGRNGVIVITTKTATVYKNDFKPVDRALLKNNVYKERLNTENTSQSVYITALKESKSITEAYNNYLELRTKYGKSIAFYFEVSDYFKQWGTINLVDRILSNVLELNFNNPVGLKALAFKYEANKNIERTSFVLKRIVRLQPKRAQSYKDMAEVYVSQQFLNKAFYLYKSMLEGTVKNVNFTGLNTPLTTEFKRLVQVHKSTLPTAGLAEDYFKTDNINARLYFEWVDPEMAFEIQFVNPQKRFFSWTHSKAFDLQRINDEKAQGFSAEEFLLIDAEKGTWLVNLTNLDVNETKNQILKISIFKNYGKANQTKKVKVINLKNYNKKATLVKVEI